MNTTTTTLTDDGTMPRLGVGTWRLGESAGTRRDEIRVVQHAIASGINRIDTAEMYGAGGAAEVVGAPVADLNTGKPLLRFAELCHCAGLCASGHLFASSEMMSPI